MSNVVKVKEIKYKMQYKFDSGFKFNELAYNQCNYVANRKSLAACVSRLAGSLLLKMLKCFEVKMKL